MDFLYHRDDFTLPYGEVLGVVRFLIDGQEFKLAAYTFERNEGDKFETAQRMQLLIGKEEYASVFKALRFGTDFQIIFPNGDVYSTTLRGSSNALAAASNCWDRNRTGPLDNNPFGNSEPHTDPVLNNPFENI